MRRVIPTMQARSSLRAGPLPACSPSAVRGDLIGVVEAPAQVMLRRQNCWQAKTPGLLSAAVVSAASRKIDKQTLSLLAR